ncbi:type IV toxin-antitoxin system AbiEi family antitoxin domain-containing protein, partial [Klebsiella pneumoniae]
CLILEGPLHYPKVKQNQFWLSVEKKGVLAELFKEFPGVEWIVISGKKLPVLDDRYRVTLDIKGKKLIGSAPELAAYELLSAVPGTLSFNHAAELFQG